MTEQQQHEEQAAPVEAAPPPEAPRPSMMAEAVKTSTARSRAERAAYDEEGTNIAVMLDRILARARAAEQLREQLPCAALANAGQITAAADACEAAGAWRGVKDERGADKGCEFAGVGEWCARERDRATFIGTRERLRLGVVPDVFAQTLLDAVPGRRDESGARLAAVALEETDALRLARAFVIREPRSVILDGDVEIRFRGDEWALVLAGPPGCGKSLAAAYVIARAGGLWISAREFSDRDRHLGDVERAPLVVIDDLGTEHDGEKRYASGRINNLIADRHQGKLRTVITTNLRRRRQNPDDETEAPGFAERYDERVNDRLNEGGRFIRVQGPSLRGRR